MGKLNGKIALVTGGNSSIRVNVVSPGPIDTPAISGLVGNDAEQEKQLNAGLPLVFH